MLEATIAIVSSFLTIGTKPLSNMLKNNQIDASRQISTIYNPLIRDKNIPIINREFNVGNVVLNVTGYVTWFKHIDNPQNKIYIPEIFLGQKKLSDDIYVNETKESNGQILLYSFDKKDDNPSELDVDTFNKLVKFERNRDKHGAGIKK